MPFPHAESGSSGTIPRTEYAKLMAQFHPEHFSAARWARTAKDAGMNYVVLTARHHDGFARRGDESQLTE